MDTRGIDFWAAVGKYRVRITRHRVGYKLGLFDTMEEALKAKQDFLSEYAFRSEDVDAVPQYTKEWFKREHIKQVEKFKELYATPIKGMPRLIILDNNTAPHYMLSTVELRLKQQSQNDGYENDFNE